MDEVVAAALVGAGLGYAARFGQEQIQRVGRALASNETVVGAAKRGREVAVSGARMAQASAVGAGQLAQAGVSGAAQVAEAGARGGALVAAAAADRIAAMRRRAGGAPAPARAVRVPVGEEPRPSRRGAARGGRQAASPGTRARGRPAGGRRGGARPSA